MDVLSSVISLVRLTTVHVGGFDLGPRACVRMPASDGVKFYTVASGSCWLGMDGDEEARRLEKDHCFFLPRNSGFRLSALVDYMPDEVAVFSEQDCGRIGIYKNGGESLVLGCHFGLSGLEDDLLFQGLPPVIHFAQTPERSRLRWLVDSLADEFHKPQPGGILATQHLAQLIFIETMRTYMEWQQKGLPGWLTGLTDPKISVALSCMYENPHHKWTVESLARLAGMSRAAFARRFNELTGQSPLDLLTRWRMALASERLSNTRQTVMEIAHSLGYESASAFTKTFRRYTGKLPRQVR